MALWPIIFGLLPFLGLLARWTAPPEALNPALLAGAAGNASDATVTAGLGEGMEGDEIYVYPAGILVWMGIAVVLAVLRCGHMCYS